MKKIAFVLLLSVMLGGVLSAEPRRVSSNKAGKPNRHSAKTEIKLAIPTDTMPIDDGMGSVKIYGYDKTVNSSVETFFVTNETEDTIVAVALTIGYYDINGRQLHSRPEKIFTTIPPGATRKADIRSWDRQNSFRYSGSSKPSRKSATPYTVKISPDTLFIYKSR